MMTGQGIHLHESNKRTKKSSSERRGTMGRQKLTFLATVVLLLTIPSLALAYNMMSADQFKARLDAKTPTILLDIQKKPAYKEHHFYGSVRTFAYPAKTDMDLDSVVQGVRMHNQSGNDIVIIGPRGGRAAKRTADYLVTRGVPDEKIFILEGGINGWPYKEMLLQLKGGCK